MIAEKEQVSVFPTLRSRAKQVSGGQGSPGARAQPNEEVLAYTPVPRSICESSRSPNRRQSASVRL